MIKSLLDDEWLKKLSLYSRVFIGFSGGLDSTVLLHNLTAQPLLVNQLTAVHINHGLSANAFNWQEHCQQFCAENGIPLIIKQIDFARQANIEEEARQARYKAFSLLLTAEDCLLLGHHLDDQAETLLLQLFRGAGIDGLAAMAARKQFAPGQLLRPLLQYSRQTLADYAKFHGLKWIEDESNQDISFTRNYLRHEVLPQLRLRWPALIRNLSRTTLHCQQAQASLDDLANIDCPELKQCSMTLPIASLAALKHARIGNVLRVWFKMNKVKLPNTVTFNRLISEVIQAKDDANPQVGWQNFFVRRYRQTLYLIKKSSAILLQSQIWSSFPQPILLEGLGTLQTKKAEKGIVLPAPSHIEIRFRQGGELFNWHGQTKQLKKLLQEWAIPPWLRNSIPLLYINSQLAAVVGYAVSDLFYAEKEQDCYQVFLK